MNLEGHNAVRHHMYRLKYTELNEIYFFMSSRSFALSLIGIFVPIYLYLSGYDLKNILLYYLFVYLTEFLFEFPSAAILKKIGPKHLMALSLPFLVSHFWLLFTLNTYVWSPYILAIPVGISLGLFWEAYHYDFSRVKCQKKATSEIGFMEILTAITGAIAPFIGGFVAERLGIQALIVFVIIMLVFGASFLFRTEDNHFIPGRLDMKKIKLKNIWRDLVSYSGCGWETVSDLQIWPLLLVLFIKGYENIGIITSVSLMVTILVTYFVMKKSDKNGRLYFLKLGGVFSFIIGIGRVFVESLTTAFAVNVGRSFAKSMQSSPFSSEYYLHADEESRSEYILWMEATVDFARVIYFTILLALSLFLSVKAVLVAGLILGAFGAIMMSLMPAAKSEINCEGAKIKITPQPKRI